MRARHLLVVLVVVAACDGSSVTEPVRPDGEAGAVGSGGATASGGAAGTGTASATGGSMASGATGGAVDGSGGEAGAGGGAGGTAGTGGMTSGGGRTGRGSDAGVDVGRLDGSPGGSGGSSGGAGAGGARTDAGGEAGADARTALLPDASTDTRPDAVPDAGSGTGSDATTRDGAPCPYAGNVTYTLTRNANASTAEQQAYPLITEAMDEAVYYYNCYTNITKKLTVTYNAGVQTVDGNINGSIRFGPNTSYMEYSRGMHEISHTVGVGTASNWQSFLVTPDGGGTRVWTGTNATAELRDITGVPTEVLYGDNQHFWPYGLNYASEVKSEADLINHCRMVMALRKDMGM